MANHLIDFETRVYWSIFLKYYNAHAKALASLLRNANDKVNLTTWLSSIEKVTKEEETIPANFENVSEYFINLLEEILSGRAFYFTSYQKKLFTDFRSYLENDNIAIKKCKPTIVNNISNFNPKFDLRSAKKTGNLKSVVSSLRKLRRQLIAVHEIYNSKCFVSQIGKSITKFPTDPSYQRYFIEYLRSRYGTRNVMKIVKGNIARIFFDLYKSRIQNKIIHDEYISKNSVKASAPLKQNFENYLKNTIQQGNFQDILKAVFLEDQAWKYIENELVQDSKIHFKLFSKSEYVKIENLQDLTSKKNEVTDLKLMIKGFISRILSHFIFSVSSKLHIDSYSTTILNLIKEPYFSQFSQLVNDAINDKENQHKASFLVGECFISEFAHVIAEENAKKIYEDVIEKELVLFSLAIIKLIREKSKSEIDFYSKA